MLELSSTKMASITECSNLEILGATPNGQVRDANKIKLFGRILSRTKTKQVSFLTSVVEMMVFSTSPTMIFASISPRYTFVWCIQLGTISQNNSIPMERMGRFIAWWLKKLESILFKSISLECEEKIQKNLKMVTQGPQYSSLKMKIKNIHLLMELSSTMIKMLHSNVILNQGNIYFMPSWIEQESITNFQKNLLLVCIQWNILN